VQLTDDVGSEAVRIEGLGLFVVFHLLRYVFDAFEVQKMQWILSRKNPSVFSRKQTITRRRGVFFHEQLTASANPTTG